ncbi:MAG TPA: hypothetical protein VK459_11055 [Polyangiaceae bacterium]|nr:hypothetical protein [Polyangiaceae bacterium]
MSDVILWALQRWVLPPPLLDNPPLTGWIRIAGYIDAALYVAWPIGIAAVALNTLAKRSMRPAIVAYVIVVAGLIIGYPTIRGEILRKVLLGIELASMLVGLASILVWRRRSERSTITALCTSVLVVGHFGTILSGPYRFGLFGEAWVLAQVAYVLIYAVVIVLQAGILWEHPST